MSTRRRPGRNQRKKVCRSHDDGEVMHIEYHSEANHKRTRKEILSTAADLFLQSSCKALDRSAIILGAKGCWALYQELLPEAVKWGVEKELRSHTVTAAHRFMGRSVRTSNVPVYHRGINEGKITLVSADVKMEQ